MTTRLDMPRCVLDSGGLSALQGRSQQARVRLRWVLDHGVQVRIPVAILVESTTGNDKRDAEVNRVLNVLARSDAALVPVTEQLARQAGFLRHRAKSDDGIDALVAAVAVGDGSPAVVLTSDPSDLERLLVGAPHVSVRAV
jgi:predicted nucleic acid-binding protein